MDRRAKTLLGMAAACAALFAVVVVGAYAWGPGRTLDVEGLTGFVQSIATGGLALAAAGAAGATVLATAGVLLADPSAATCCARDHTAFVVVAGGVASAAVALPVTVATVARRG